MKGGKQPGAGRPVSTDPARHIVKARLTDEQYARWMELGGSRWLKRMLSEYSGKYLENSLTTPKNIARMHASGTSVSRISPSEQ